MTLRLEGVPRQSAPCGARQDHFSKCKFSLSGIPSLCIANWSNWLRFVQNLHIFALLERWNCHLTAVSGLVKQVHLFPTGGALKMHALQDHICAGLKKELA